MPASVRPKAGLKAAKLNRGFHEWRG